MNQAEFRNKLRERIRDKVVIVGVTPIVAEITPTRRPVIPSILYVAISGATAWGTVGVVGIDSAGVPTTEDIVFAANGTKPTSKAYKTVTKITAAGFTGGDIEIKTTYKDFDDAELDNVIAGALQKYARYRPQIVVEEIVATAANEYDMPSGSLWIQNITDLLGKDLLWQERNGKYLIVCYSDRSYFGYLTIGLSMAISVGIDNLSQFRIYYAAIPAIEDVRADMIEALILCCEALCDRMKSEEPDRWVGYSVNVPGVEKLDISAEFRTAYERKMREFDRRVGVPYGCRS